VSSSSQTLVFSKTSLQASLINPQNPRAIYFNDSVAIAWVPGGNIEVAAQDPQKGTVFYTLSQRQEKSPRFLRADVCLLCHVTSITENVPGLFVRSVLTATDGIAMPQLGQGFTDHRTPLDQRWGGWYVTGKDVTARHMGNKLTSLADHQQVLATPCATPQALQGMSAYPVSTSDIAALLVLDHQARMSNLLIRMGVLARYTMVAQGQAGTSSGEVPVDSSETTQSSLDTLARELVDYMLFVDEAPLPSPVHSSSRFAKEFSAVGPHDRKGRSLRQLDLRHRLLRYPCSYLIYSPLFTALPDLAKQAIYRRMWDVLSGQERSVRYVHLAAANRRAIMEILRATKEDLPTYFFAVRH